MECKEYVEFTVDSPHGDYKAGRFGIIVGFCRGGDDVPCAIVRKPDQNYVMAPITSVKHVTEGAIPNTYLFVLNR